MPKSAGLTFIEILIVISLLGLISFPLYLSYTKTQANQGLTSSLEQLATEANRAHLYSREAKNQKIWGVKRDSDKSYSLINGSSHDNWTAVTTTQLEPYVSIPQDFTVWFDIGTGEVDQDYSLVLENRYGRQGKINISQSGNVETQLIN